MPWQLDPSSPNGISKKEDKGYTPYFAGGPGKPSLLDSVNGKHGAVRISGGDNVTVDDTGTDIVIGSTGGGATYTVYHGSTGSTSRPTNTAPIIWVGSVEPLNALDNDAWIDIS